MASVTGVGLVAALSAVGRGIRRRYDLCALPPTSTEIQPSPRVDAELEQVALRKAVFQGRFPGLKGGEARLCFTLERSLPTRVKALSFHLEADSNRYEAFVRVGDPEQGRLYRAPLYLPVERMVRITLPLRVLDPWMFKQQGRRRAPPAAKISQIGIRALQAEGKRNFRLEMCYITETSPVRSDTASSVITPDHRLLLSFSTP